MFSDLPRVRGQTGMPAVTAGHQIEQTSEFVRVLLYADDLLIIITLPASLAANIMSIITDALSSFSRHAGLQVNYGKSGILLKGASC